jgi:hypothetical protein
MELTYKLKDKTIETDRWELSADGKTLTNTLTFPRQSKPEIDVYDSRVAPILTCSNQTVIRPSPTGGAWYT